MANICAFRLKPAFFASIFLKSSLSISYFCPPLCLYCLLHHSLSLAGLLLIKDFSFSYHLSISFSSTLKIALIFIYYGFLTTGSKYFNSQSSLLVYIQSSILVFPNSVIPEHRSVHHNYPHELSEYHTPLIHHLHINKSFRLSLTSSVGNQLACSHLIFSGTKTEISKSSTFSPSAFLSPPIPPPFTLRYFPAVLQSHMPLPLNPMLTKRSIPSSQHTLWGGT